MRLVPYVLLVTLFCTASGCALFGKKTNEPGKRPWFAGGDTQPKKIDTPQDPLQNSSFNANEESGMLAGRVLIKRTGEPTTAHVRVVPLDEAADQAAPLDVVSTPQGFFTIHGVKPGKHYKLVARTKQGEQLLAGTRYARAPNIHVVIEIDPSLVTKDVPPIPPPPKLPEPPARDEGAKDPLKGSGKADTETKNPGFGIRPPDAADGKSAAPRVQWDDPAEQQGPKAFPENFAASEPSIPRSPPVRVPGGMDRLPPPPKRPDGLPDALPDTPGFSGMKTPIPSCVILGTQVINFALLDVYGNPWEWKKDRIGKLVLLDFWKTSCIPCRQAIPHLRILQERYGPHGLEVISIASEQEGTFEQQKYKVAGVCNRYQTNYRLLLNSGPGDAQFLAKFNIQAYPTLLLLDERGQILWRHQGTMSRSDLDALESHLRLRLGMH